MSQKGFGVLNIIFAVIGVLILVYAIWVGSLFLRYQRDVKLQEEKDKGYQVYLESLKSASPSANTQ